MSATTPFAAVLLAGGRSQRMGRDKALLPLANGQPLWRRQLAVLEALRPAELFISGPARAGFPTSIKRLEDEIPGLGPLGGVVAALRAIHAPRLLVLAVDLPAMTTDFLRSLLMYNPGPSPGRGVIPQTGDSFFEPLAAVYPRDALAAAEAQMRGEDRSLQTFARGLVEDGRAAVRPVAEVEANLFINWNRPEDLDR